MPARIEESEWRQIRWERHGSELYKEMRQTFKTESFNIQNVANLNTIDHLSDRSAYDHATAICRELEVRGKLKRQGRKMKLKIRKAK